MKIIGVILNTFRESIRDKVFITIIIFAVLVMAGGKIIQPLALGEEAKVVKDIGLNSIALFSTLIAILVGGRLVYKEIEKRTLYLIITRPIHRWQFIVGKYFGLLLVLFESILIMTCAFYLIMILLNISAGLNLLLSVLFTFFELLVITAIAILFSTFSTPITGAVFTFAIYFIGHLTRDLKTFGAMSKSNAVKTLCDIMYYVLPNLANFNIKGEVVHNVTIAPQIIVLTIAYAVVYSAIIVFASCIIFQRKDF